MQILFTRIIHFTRLIKAGGRLREFNLRKLQQPGKEIFSVDTVDDRGNRIIFRMEKEGNSAWNIVSSEQPLPAWIPEVEPKLREKIEEELLLHQTDAGK
jgi:hypothetical protein